MGEYRQLMDSFWRWRLAESPEFASMCGTHGAFDGKLDSWDLAAFDARKEAAKSFLAKGRQLLSDASSPVVNADIPSPSSLPPSPADVVNVELLCYDLETFVSGLDAKGYLFPLSLMEGPQIEFELVFGPWIDKAADDGFDNLTSRLKAFPRQMDEKIACLRRGVETGIVLHASSLVDVPEAVKALVNDGTPFVDAALSGIEKSSKDAEAKASLGAAVRKIVAEEIQPAFGRLLHFLTETYLPATRRDVAARSLPDGDNFYLTCLRFHASYYAVPEEVHRTGLAEVGRILTEMKQITDELGFEGTLQDFNDYLRSEPRFYFDDKEEMMKEFEDLVFRRIRPLWRPLFPDDAPDADRFPLKIEPTPATQTQGPMGFYLAGTADGSRPGVFYVNCHNYDKEPKYQMAALSLHEAEPGHHLQAVYSLASGDKKDDDDGGGGESIPQFRQTLEDRLYTIVPSRFPIHSAYAEGWALYCESLGIEMGVYDGDLYALHAKYQFEILRSARLVVDTGLHWMGWSKERAVRYLVDNTALSLANIEFEVNRYITWPGQACAYKIGELAIKDMRRTAAERLGGSFDVRQFHKCILQTGFVPLSVLKEKVDNWVDEQAKGLPPKKPCPC